MSQVDDGDSVEYRVRRQRRSTVTIAVILLSLAGAFYYASSYFRDTAPRPGPCTTEQPVGEVKPADVAVNVYNSTTKPGLALATSKIVAQRGFKVRTVGNDPARKLIKGVAQIRYGPEGAASAKVLARHVPGAVLLQDKRTTDTVDLSVGTGWKGFGPVPTATAAAETLRPCPTVTVEG